MGTTYRKTAKGIDEIQTRAHKLPPRVRSVLILVDGQRSDEELQRMVQSQGAETLQMLLTGGFIEAALATAPPPATTPTSAPATRQVDVALVRREAVRRLTELVGPAGEELCIRIERCKDLETLRPLLAAARQVIGNMRGPQAAAEYISALSAL